MEYNSRSTIYQKMGASVINAGVVIAGTGIWWLLGGAMNNWQWYATGAFFIFNILFIFRRDRRELGMLVLGLYWEKSYSLWQYILYDILYSVSFATLLWWIWLPFDMFILNIVLLQLPSIWLSGTTLHGLVSGRMRTQIASPKAQ